MNKKFKNKKVYLPNRQGLTFVEAIINIYVYVLLITVCTMVAITYVKTRVVIRQKQQAVEEISLAMNEMGKIIRMSSCNETLGCGGGSALNITSNQDTIGDVNYEFTGTDLNINGTLMMDKVDGEFYITRESGIPLITIKLEKLDRNDDPINGTEVKTSVSMRSGYEIETP